MFTGLVEALGEIRAVVTEGAGVGLHVATGFGTDGLAPGDSVAVDGICLTADRVLGDGSFRATAGRETVQHTTAGTWTAGRPVHLERALTLQSRLGGHLVSGHVDACVVVKEIHDLGESRVLWVEAPPALRPYVAVKGSVALDGVSLTVNEVRGGVFRVNLIPHTWNRTRFRLLRPGDAVNLEVDLLARYVERLLRGAPPVSTELPEEEDPLLARLKGAGFVGRK